MSLGPQVPICERDELSRAYEHLRGAKCQNGLRELRGGVGMRALKSALWGRRGRR